MSDLPRVRVGDGDDWGAVNRGELLAFFRAALAAELEDGSSFVLLDYIRRLQAERAANARP